MARRPETVLFLDARREFGGDGAVLRDILQTLDRRRLRPLVALPGDGELRRALDAIPALERAFLGYGQGGGGRLGRLWDAAKTLASLTVKVWREGIRTVHANNTRRASAFAAALWVASLGRIRLIHHGHCHPQPSLAHRLARRLASEVWAVSTPIAEAYREAGARRVRILENGCDVRPAEADARPRLRAEMGLGVGEPALCVVGRLAPRKGPHIAIAAFARWRARAGRGQLWVIGDDAIADGNAGYAEELRRLAASLGVADSVRFLGFRRDVKALLSAADLVLMPSENESFGLVAIEAVAARKPLLACGSGGLGEVLGQLGIAPVARCPEAFAAAIAPALETWAGELERRAACTRERYSLEAFAARVEAALEAA